MKVLYELEDVQSDRLPSMPDGIYSVGGSMVASVVGGIPSYLPLPSSKTMQDYVHIPTPEVSSASGNVSEDFALKIAAMAFERDTIPKSQS